MKKQIQIGLLACCILGFYNSGAQTEVTYYTTKGTFKTVLTDALTPVTVDSFISRVVHKFYDGLIFHRVVAGFVIQGGDPLGTGYGGPGYTTPDEYDPSLKNVTGALAMANSGPNTDGSQFYINLVSNPSLNNHYTVFGMTTYNLSVVQSIGLVPVDANSRPLTPVVMDSVRITHLHTSSVSTMGRGVMANVFPNPGKGNFNIDLPELKTKIEIINMLGRTVFSAEALGKFSADLSGQGSGLYLLRLSNADGVSESKLVVQ